MNYQKLEIWQLANELVRDTFTFVKNEVPRFHQNELGSQLRRSIVSVKANIVEGNGRKHYQKEYIRFLIYARASLDESSDHIGTILSVYEGDIENGERLLKTCSVLGKKLTRLIQVVEQSL